MIYVKHNIYQNSKVLAVCDEDLIGKKYFEKGLKLDVNETFYKGNLVAEEEAVDLMKKSRNINIVGKESIKLAIKFDIIKKENIIKIKNIPHAVVFEL
ncbi:MAG: DUF424 family protein [Nanoarchaeota archaeon]